MIFRRGLAACSVAVVALAAAASANAGTIVVSPANASGWTAESGACSGAITSTQGFVAGPSSPPAGSGSRAFAVGTNEDSLELYRQSGYQGVKIADLEELSYYTYIANFALPPFIAPYLTLAVDHNGDGDFTDPGDDHLIFEPARQGSPVVPGVWQRWDTISGNWYQRDTGPSPLFPLKGGANAWATVNPPSQIINDVPAGGLFVGAGCGASGPYAGTWTDFSGNVDALTIKATGITDPTYDFEAATPAPPQGPPPPQPSPAPSPGPPGTADLSIAKTGSPDPVAVGGILTYDIAVANFGPSTASATVKDTLPSSVDFISATASKGSCSGTQIVTCDLGEMARDTSASVRIVVRPTVIGTIENSASVSSSTSDSFSGNNNTRVSTKVVDKRAPKVVLGGARRCTLGGDRACVVEVQSDESGTAALTGSVSFKGSAASARFGIRRVSRQVSASKRYSLRVKLRGRARRAVRAALGRGKAVRAKLRVVVKDRAGNRTTKRRRLRIVS